MRITALEVTFGRTASTIIIYNHRVLLGCIEVRRQIVSAINGITLRVDEVPIAALAQLYILQDFLAEVFHQCRLSFLDIERIKAVGIHGTLSIISHQRSMVCQADAFHQIFLHIHRLNLSVLRVHPIEADVVAVFGSEIDLSVHLVPYGLLHTRVEMLGHRSDFLVGQVHDVQLVIVLIRNPSFRQVQANASKRFG